MVTVVNLDVLRLAGGQKKVKVKWRRRISCLMIGDYSIGLCVPR